MWGTLEALTSESVKPFWCLPHHFESASNLGIFAWHVILFEVRIWDPIEEMQTLRTYCTPCLVLCCNVHYRGTLEHLWNACRLMAATVHIPTVHRRLGIQDGRMWLALAWYSLGISARNPVIELSHINWQKWSCVAGHQLFTTFAHFWERDIDQPPYTKQVCVCIYIIEYIYIYYIRLWLSTLPSCTMIALVFLSSR